MASKYGGILATARPYEPMHGLLADDAARAAWVERYTAAALERWRALYKAYGVAWGNESELLRRLAEAHVPGFRMRGPSGPRPKWCVIEKAELRIAVDEYVADRKRKGTPASIAQACAVFARREPWATMLRNGKNSVQALRGHYNTADSRWVNVVRDARAWDALPAHEKVTLGDLGSLARNQE